MEAFPCRQDKETSEELAEGATELSFHKSDTIN